MKCLQRNLHNYTSLKSFWDTFPQKFSSKCMWVKEKITWSSLLQHLVFCRWYWTARLHKHYQWIFLITCNLNTLQWCLGYQENLPKLPSLLHYPQSTPGNLLFVLIKTLVPVLGLDFLITNCWENIILYFQFCQSFLTIEGQISYFHFYKSFLKLEVSYHTFKFIKVSTLAHCGQKVHLRNLSFKYFQWKFYFFPRNFVWQ